MILARRKQAHVAKILVDTDYGKLMLAGPIGNVLVRGGSQTDVANVRSLVPILSQQFSNR
jgi:hypothetical protein